MSAALLGPMSLLSRRGLGGVVWPLAAQQAAALSHIPWRSRLIKKLFDVGGRASKTSELCLLYIEPSVRRHLNPFLSNLVL